MYFFSFVFFVVAKKHWGFFSAGVFSVGQLKMPVPTMFCDGENLSFLGSAVAAPERKVLVKTPVVVKVEPAVEVVSKVLVCEDLDINDIIPEADLLPKCADWKVREVSEWLSFGGAGVVKEVADTDTISEVIFDEVVQVSEVEVSAGSDVALGSNDTLYVSGSGSGSMLNDSRQVLVLLRGGATINRAWIVGEGYRNTLVLSGGREHRLPETLVDGLIHAGWLIDNNTGRLVFKG